MILCRFQVEGFHRWPEAPGDVVFLSYEHRHVFHVQATKEVAGDDREIEFISFGRRMRERTIEVYGQDFGARSCEQIARWLLEEFDLYSCEVTEDGENGAIVFA
jgi:hypothetical protein